MGEQWIRRTGRSTHVFGSSRYVGGWSSGKGYGSILTRAVIDLHGILEWKEKLNRGLARWALNAYLGGSDQL
jgi:hypothetical protein